MEWSLPQITTVLMSNEELEKAEMLYRHSRMSDDVKQIAADVKRRYGRF